MLASSLLLLWERVFLSSSLFFLYRESEPVQKLQRHTAFFKPPLPSMNPSILCPLVCFPEHSTVLDLSP